LPVDRLADQDPYLLEVGSGSVLIGSGIRIRIRIKYWIWIRSKGKTQKLYRLENGAVWGALDYQMEAWRLKMEH
jgi:hypothetical protein